MKIKNNEGITLMALTITIIVMIIIAGIAVYSGTEQITVAKIQNLRTNMLLIQAKTKEYVEEVSFKMGPSPDETKRSTVQEEVYETKGKLTKLSNAPTEVQSSATSIGLSNFDNCYYVGKDALNNMGLQQVKEETGNYYIVKFDETNVKAEIYNTKGLQGKYSLTDIEEL